jgi:hypothetical protein
MGIQINGVNDIISATDGGFSLSGAELTNLSQVNVTGVGTFANLVVSGNVSIAGTLTYEDVTNVDSIGIVTARTGVRIDAGGIVVVGVTTVAAGTTALPSISPTGDSNTGIFFPSADTIAFAEGGAEAARFDSSGRLLVGTSSGSGNSTAHFQGNAGASIGGAFISLQRGATNPSNGTELATISFADNAPSQGARIQAFTDGDWAASDYPTRLVFSTTADGASSPTERMRIDSAGTTTLTSATSTAPFIAKISSSEKLRIDSSGRLLIGTSSAVGGGSSGELLQVGFSGGSRAILANTSTSLANDALLGQIDFTTNVGSSISTGANIKANCDGTAAAGDAPTRLTFWTTADGASSPTERMRIDSSGRFGIGTSSVSKKLQVNYTDNANHSTSNGTYDVLVWNTADIASYPNCSAGIQLRAGNTSAGAGSIHGIRKGPSNQGELAFAITDNAGNSVEKARFTATGLGIGTTTPGTLLHLSGNGGTGVLKLEDPANGMAGVLAADPTALSLGTTTNHPLRLFVNSVEKARIDTSGRLLVGTSTAREVGLIGGDEAPLQIETPQGLICGLTLIQNRPDSYGPNLRFGKTGGTTVGSVTTVSDGYELGTIQFCGADGTDLTSVGALIQAVVDGTPGNDDMPGRLVFSTTADGASSSTERMRLTSEGRFFVPGVWNFSTSSGTNVVVTSENQIRKAASSIKYKTDVEELQDSYADQILNIRPVWYRSLCDGDDPNHSYWGFIAEEVAEIDPRLTTWKFHNVSYDENGSRIVTKLDNPEPEGVAYDRFVPHLLNLVKRQQQAIETLEAKVAALESA